MSNRHEHDRIDAEISRISKSSDPFVAAVRATRMPMIITDPNKPDNPIVFVNDAFSKLTGYARAEILGNNCRFLQGPETDHRDVARIRDAIERRVPIEIELLNHKKSGEVFWNRLLISPVFDDDGALTYFFASQFDVTLERDRMVRLQRDRDALEQEVERRASDLRHSEDRLRFMLKAGRFGTWTLDLADRRLVASDMCKRNFGRSGRDPFTYEDLTAAIVPEDRARMEAAVASSIEEQADYDIEYRIRTPQGEIRWLQIRGQTYYHADGSPLSMAGVSIDITERKRGEEHRALLADELNHRVKNSMATMQSIAHQTLRNASSLDEARDTLDARLQSLSAAHDVLTRESWEGATLAEIVDSALKPFQSGGGRRFHAGGPDLRLPPRLALAFVMALHELATNAVKYGALSNDTGRVILNWDVVDGSKPDRLWLRWEELGGPPVTPPSRTGFGSRLIERALAAELGGTAEIDYRPRGVVFTVEAPLPER
ncbi:MULTISPECIES: HWE histidine kinase domain-containing protein [Methylobacterium]|uniref:HWE histidine kinase domain-containing protein n=1 Tax=Methylobacterium TaxID=407 RepID=UPI00104E6508|nr:MULTISPECIES: HWE histidine kinase domain-containing protein [Methylobacterium]MDR7037277.1 PAS domain S-box-containing protein [Methylobacterium sp. BE186]